MDEIDVEKIYKEIYEQELAWSKLNDGYGGIAHLLKEVEHPGKKHFEEIIKNYTPEELEKLEAVKKGARKRTTLKVNITDLEKIGKLIDRLEIVTEENLRLQAIETKFNQAKEAYFSDPDTRKATLAVKAVQTLGWSSGKRPKKISSSKILLEYMSLIKNENPMGKWEALELLADKFGLASKEAAMKHVQAGIKQFKDAYQLFCSDWGFSHIAAKINPDKYTGIQPPNWPSTEE